MKSCWPGLKSQVAGGWVWCGGMVVVVVVVAVCVCVCVGRVCVHVHMHECVHVSTHMYAWVGGWVDGCMHVCLLCYLLPKHNEHCLVNVEVCCILSKVNLHIIHTPQMHKPL